MYHQTMVAVINMRREMQVALKYCRFWLLLSLGGFTKHAFVRATLLASIAEHALSTMQLTLHSLYYALHIFLEYDPH